MRKRISKKLMILTSLLTVIGIVGIYTTSKPDESFLKNIGGGWDGPCVSLGSCGGQSFDTIPPGETHCDFYVPPECGSGWCSSYCAEGDDYESCVGLILDCNWSLAECSPIFDNACEWISPTDCDCKPYGQPTGKCYRGNC